MKVCFEMMSRILIITGSSMMVTSAAQAHIGHIGEVAGHGHLIGLAGLAAAAAMAALLAKLSKDETGKDEASDEAEGEITSEPQDSEAGDKAHG